MCALTFFVRVRSTPRRFGKTFSWAFAPRKNDAPPPHAPSSLRPLTPAHRIAIFCACLALSFGLEIVVFSAPRTAQTWPRQRLVDTPFMCVCVQAQPVARRASSSNGSSNSCAWRAASPRSSSTTRKPVVCTRSTARNHSSAAFRPLQRTKPPQPRSCALTQPLCVLRSKVGVSAFQRDANSNTQ